MRNLDSCCCWRCALCPWEINFVLTFETVSFFCVYPVYLLCWLCVVRVVARATVWLLVQKSPTRCVCVSNCLWSKNFKRGGLDPSWAVAPQKKKKKIYMECYTSLNKGLEWMTIKLVLNAGFLDPNVPTATFQWMKICLQINKPAQNSEPTLFFLSFLLPSFLPSSYVGSCHND